MVDDRKDYGETRYIAVGRINNREYVLVFTRPNANETRIVSLRKANSREVVRY